jgi:hypothetical protein
MIQGYSDPRVKKSTLAAKTLLPAHSEETSLQFIIMFSYKVCGVCSKIG